jgi:homoserine kinase type II
MAVKTTYTGEDFTAILAGYRLGELVRSEPISAGTVQTNYRLETSIGTYVFRGYENRTPEQVRFECQVLEYLRHRGYPCPYPLRDRHGAAMGRWQDKPFVIFPFLRGSPVEAPNARHRQQLIQKAAQLQALTRGYRPRSTEYRWNYGPDLCLRLAREKAHKLDSAQGWAKLAWYEAQLARLELPRGMPKGICHCDFHFSNILFDGDEFVALIDFDDANYTYLVFDLVGMLEAWAWTYPRRELDLEEAQRVAAEYARYRPLNPTERRHLFDVFQLSILIDCIWYFDRGGADDFYEKRKIDFLNHLGRDAFTAALFHKA